MKSSEIVKEVENILNNVEDHAAVIFITTHTLIELLAYTRRLERNNGRLLDITACDELPTKRTNDLVPDYEYDYDID